MSDDNLMSTSTLTALEYLPTSDHVYVTTLIESTSSQSVLASSNTRAI